MKSVNFQKKFEADLRKKYLPDLETEAGLVGLVGVQYDRVIIKVDSTKEDKKTVYEHDGTTWVYVNKVENIEHEISFTDDHNIYITDKDRKPKLMGDVLPFEDIDDLLDKDPAIYNKLYITKKGKLYYYNSDGAYKLVSGGGGAGGTNRLADVATYAEIITTYPKPDDFDSVVVLADETVNGQSTWYFYTGTEWAYQGIYFNETVESILSDRNIRVSDIAPNVDYVIPLKYLVGKKHLEIYIEGELLVLGIDYTEVGTDTHCSEKIQFKNTIPKEARLIFKRVLSSFSGDSMISRISSETWLKYANASWAELNALVTSLGFDAVTKSINVDATAEAVVKTVPSKCRVGTRLSYRKIDSSTNGITINMPAGETVTRANLSTLTLTSRGAYWEIEKTTDTTWELKGGYDTGTAANGTSAGNFIKSYDGNMIIRQFINVTKKSGPAAVGGLYEYALNDIPVIKKFVDVNYYISWDSSGDNGAYGVTIHTIGKSTSAIATKYIAIHNGVTAVTGYTTLNGRWF